MARKPAQKELVQREIREVVLRFLEGENEGVEIRVNPPRILFVGRSEECDIFLGEKKISRKHCKIEVTNQTATLQDLQSTNGTYLNGKKATSNPLKHEDKIRVGTSVIQVAINTETSIGEAKADQEPEEAKERAGGTVKETLPKGPEAFPLEDDEPSGIADIPATGGFSFDKAAPALEPEEDQEPEPEPSYAPEPLGTAKPKTLSGNLSAMGLADLLQNLGQNKKSGMLRLRMGREGRIWVVEGRVVGAELERVSGTKALFRLLGWSEGSFELLPLSDAFKESEIVQPIKDPIEGLLMEGFRHFDEIEKLKKSLPPHTTGLKLKPRFTAPLSKLHPRVLDVLQVVINEGRFEDVLDSSPLSDLETCKVVFYLLKRDYIVTE
ncbi:MAG: DUF4388 domain-containing protein [Pseudomonadota bacterium]